MSDETRRKQQISGSETRLGVYELQQMEAVAFSCNQIALQDISALIRRQLNGRPFTFIEYLANEPIPKTTATIDNSIFFFPFLRREAERASWHKERIGSTQRYEIHLHDDDFWRRQAGELSLYQYPGSIDLISSDVLKNGCNNLAQRSWHSYRTESEAPCVVIASLDDLKVTAWRIDQLGAVEGTSGAKLEYALFGQALVDAGIGACILCFPIASSRLFYGYALLLLPTPSNDDLCRRDVVCPQLRKVYDGAARAIRRIHLPTLAFLHETLYEQRAKKEHVNAAFTTTVFESLVPNRTTTSPLDSIEDVFCNLWKNRRKHCTDKHDLVDKSFIFATYLLASPEMVKQTLEAIQRAPLLRPKKENGRPKKGASLPSAIIYGEPGSGKEAMAKLLVYLSDEYFDKPITFVNMAAIRPSALVAPIFQGLTITRKIESILLPQNSQGALPGDQDDPSQQAFILDELNSLDVDMQGVLLRILEQGELQPMLGGTTRYIAHLIVGIVNEDPEKITREHELEELLRAGGALGTLATAFVGNALRRGRRLRDDLFHRLRRGAYIRLPRMNERREDLPFMFLCFVRDVIDELLAIDQAQAGKVEAERATIAPPIYIDYRAYELVMDGSLDWSGNIRRVQQFSRRVALDVYKAYKKERPPGGIYVNPFLVDKCLKAEFGHRCAVSGDDPFDEGDEG